jgi:ribosomal protein S18 acetylase RimI-like enzyme
MDKEVIQSNIERREVVPYTLRTATADDFELLFDVSTRAMEHVDKALNPSKDFDKVEELRKYREKFVPEEIQIISYRGEDVGRLRVVRSDESIYIGGIQIPPEHQGKGIGTALFSDLIKESEETGLPITLEVHDVNENALKFYTKLGFTSVGHEVGKTLMEYRPISS